jgi:predicted nucleotidyltransferase
MELDEALVGLRAIGARHERIDLLLLHGSRSRGDAHAGSDWDLGFLTRAGVDPAALHADATELLGTDRVDVVDLARASALLRFAAARDGRCVYERTPGAHGAFVLEATRYWCDVEAVIRRAQAAVLESLTT